MKSAIGYLLHRYNNPGVCKAIIFVDENISHDGKANGGTGKSILGKSLAFCRNVTFYDGKEIKSGSWFKNQRIDVTTDIVVYDDLQKDFSIETIFSMLTSGITIEKKRQDEIFIKPESAPKFVLSSNYIVKGPGGSSDIRRRYEFELSDFFVRNKPYDVYGNQFFSEWHNEEWDKFFCFMFECIQEYLKIGLIDAQPINLKQHRLINLTCLEFEAFSKKHFKINKWLDKRQLVKLFETEYPHIQDFSSNKMTRWTKEYCYLNQYSYLDKSTGGKYLFFIGSKK